MACVERASELDKRAHDSVLEHFPEARVADSFYMLIESKQVDVCCFVGYPRSEHEAPTQRIRELIEAMKAGKDILVIPAPSPAPARAMPGRPTRPAYVTWEVLIRSPDVRTAINQYGRVIGLGAKEDDFANFAQSVERRGRQ
jgi:hypothetical protein